MKRRGATAVGRAYHQAVGHMSGAGTFTVVNGKTLCDAVRATLQTLFTWRQASRSLWLMRSAKVCVPKPHLLVTAIIDLDPVYRLGFGGGAQGAAGSGRAAALRLRQQEGLRVGLLVTDERTLVYAPTPLLIEAGSTSEQKPNAIVISPTPIRRRRCCAHVGRKLQRCWDAATAAGRGWPATCDTDGRRASLASLKEVPRRNSRWRASGVSTSRRSSSSSSELTGYRLSAKRVEHRMICSSARRRPSRNV